jgi:hypothetical protein
MERTEVFEKNQTAIAYPDCKNPKHQCAVTIEPDGKVAGEKGVQSGAAARALHNANASSGACGLRASVLECGGRGVKGADTALDETNHVT